MEFESRMRKVIKDIMDPLIDKVKKQDAQLLHLGNDRDNSIEWLDFIEECLF